MGSGSWVLCCMVYASWFMDCNVWCMVYGSWCMVYGVWFMVMFCGRWFMVYCVWNLLNCRMPPAMMSSLPATGGGVGFRVQSLRLWAEGLGFMAYGLGFMVYGSWFMVYGAWCMVYIPYCNGGGVRIQGLGVRASGSLNQCLGFGLGCVSAGTRKSLRLQNEARAKCHGILWGGGDGKPHGRPRHPHNMQSAPHSTQQTTDMRFLGTT